MAKSKRTSIQRRPPPAQLENPRQEGLRAFHANRFDEAIHFWSLVVPQDDALRSALAEAHFRRALNSGPTDRGLEDMLRAVKLLPDEPRYRLHLGRFLQLRNDRAGAIAEYRAALERDPASAVAARLLACAELEQRTQVDIRTLPAAGAALIAPAQALLQGKQPPAGDETPLGHFWRGLSRLAGGDVGAVDDLNDPRPLNATLTALRRYYQGVAAARQGNYEQALKLWQQLEASGQRITSLRDNLSVVQFQRLRSLYEAGDPAAATLAQQTVSLPGGVAFDELRLLALDQGAYAAATAGDWQRAIALWEAARIVLGNASGMGSPRPLLHNLALAYEQVEHWEPAADAWRAMLRTRPRRKAGARGAAEGAAAEGAAGDLSDQHWAWVRERIITCYKHAGRPDEGVVVFRQMLKEDPDDLDLRVQLVDALLANEQERAAANEVERILKLDPQHVGGLLRKIALLDSRMELPQSEQIMRDLLANNPEREDLRQLAARLFLQHGGRYAEWGRAAVAYQAFVEGEQYDPENYLYALNQARMLIGLRRKDEIPPLVERALALSGGESQALAKIFETWVIADNIDQAQALLSRLEGEGKLNADACAELGVAILLRVTPPPTAGLFGLLGMPTLKPAPPVDTPWTRLAVELMNKATSLQPDDLALHVRLATELLLPRSDLAQPFAEAAVRLAPDDAEPLLLLGMVQGLNDQVREAKATLKRVGVLARRSGNSDLAQEAQELGRAIGTPMFRAAVQMSVLGGDPFGFDDLDLDDFDDFPG